MIVFGRFCVVLFKVSSSSYNEMPQVLLSVQENISIWHSALPHP